MRMTTLSLLAGLALAPMALGGCMMNMHPVPRSTMKEIKKESREPMDIMLKNGRVIHEVKLVGILDMGGHGILVVETPDDKHMLIRADQIVAATLDTGDDEDDEDNAGPEGKMNAPENGPKDHEPGHHPEDGPKPKPGHRPGPDGGPNAGPKPAPNDAPPAPHKKEDDDD